jgi:hypothetical protein
MTIDMRERLRRIDPAPLDVDPPSGALGAVAVIREIERRIGMGTRDTTNDTETPIGVTETIDPGATATANDTPTKQAGKRRWSGALVAAAVLGVVVAVGAVVLLASGGGDDLAPTAPGEDPASILAAYFEAHNSGDVEAAIAFFADDAVVFDHPQDFDDIATGDEIRLLEREHPLVQGSGDGMEVFNVTVDGSTVTFHHRFFYGADGIHSGLVAGCAGSVFDSVTVVDGKITVYDWGTQTRTVCP